MTYEEIAFQVIGKEFKIEDPNQKLSILIDNNKNEKQKIKDSIMEQATSFKSTVRFKNILDEYIFEVEKRFIPDRDFTAFNRVFMTKEEIHSLFYREYSYLPLVRRIDEIKKHMMNKLFNSQKEIIKEYEEEAQYEVSKAKFENENIEIQRAVIRDIYNTRDNKIKEASKDIKRIVLEYFSDNKILDAMGYYKEFLDVYFKDLVRNRIPDEQIKYILDSFSALQRKDMIETEDLAPLMYLTYMIHGIKTKFEIKHIVIDEAQDFSEFQFYVFKKIVKSNSMTILGDLSQGIYGYRGTKNWQKTMDIVFEGDTDLQYLTLKKTYRTTAEVMNLGNVVISHIQDKLKCPLGEPVMKSGAPVTILKFNSEEDMCNRILERLEEFKKMNFKNIAIICKTVGDCLVMEQHLNRGDIHIISDKDSEYNGGISIVPSYLSKGLEFDAVIITNCDDFNYTESEVDTKLLYVCITRAMNVLDIYSVDEPCKLLKSTGEILNNKQF